MRNWQNITSLRQLGEVSVFFLRADGATPVQPPEGITSWQLSEAGFVDSPLSSVRPSARSFLAEHCGCPSKFSRPGILASELNALLHDFSPDLVLLEELDAHVLIDFLVSYHGRVVLDCHNIETQLSRVMMSYAVQEGHLSADDAEAHVDYITRAEKNLLAYADQAWVCSDVDLAILKKTHRDKVAVQVVPNAIDVKKYHDCANSAGRNSTKSILFPAHFAYYPNMRAAEFLISEVLPLARRYEPAVKLILAGRCPSEIMTEAMCRSEGLLVAGEVADMEQYFALASALVVPLVIGSGTRFKILEAFASRVPVVSTQLGAEGIQAVSGSQMLLAESPHEFVQALVSLWRDPDLSWQLTTNALSLVRERYSQEVASTLVMEAIACLGIA